MLEQSTETEELPTLLFPTVATPPLVQPPLPGLEGRMRFQDHSNGNLSLTMSINYTYGEEKFQKTQRNALTFIIYRSEEKLYAVYGKIIETACTQM